MDNCITFPGKAGEAAASLKVQLLASDLCDTMHIPCRPWYADDVAWLLDVGIEPAMLMMVAESTCYALRPSWTYFRAICRNCIQEGCKDAHGYIQRLDDWRANRERFGGYKAQMQAYHYMPQDYAALI